MNSLTHSHAHITVDMHLVSAAPMCTSKAPKVCKGGSSTASLLTVHDRCIQGAWAQVTPGGLTHLGPSAGNQVVATATPRCSQLRHPTARNCNCDKRKKDTHNNQKPFMGQGSGGQYNQTVGLFVQAGCTTVDHTCVVYPCLVVCSSGPHVDVYRTGFRYFASLYHAQGWG